MVLLYIVVLGFGSQEPEVELSRADGIVVVVDSMHAPLKTGHSKKRISFYPHNFGWPTSSAHDAPPR